MVVVYYDLHDLRCLYMNNQKKWDKWLLKLPWTGHLLCLQMVRPSCDLLNLSFLK